VPIVLQIELNSDLPKGRVIDVEWRFSNHTAPCDGFEWTAHSGRWRPLVLDGSLQVCFVARRAGTEIVTASVRWKVGNVWFPETEPYVWTVTIRAPRPHQPTVQNQGVKLDLVETPKGDLPALVCAVRFDFSVDAAGASGQLSAIQLVDSETMYVTGTTAGRYATDDAYVLDTQDNDRYLYRDPVPIDQLFVMEDRPETGLPTDNDCVTDDSKFITALMFRSSSHPHACWVPLLYVAWKYKACAAQQDGLRWVLILGEMESTGTVAPVAPDLIAWERTYLDIQEQQVTVYR
jgi:hypothetical protein